MATENDSNDDLYGYDGYEKATPDVMSIPQLRQARQDSGVDFEVLADVTHHEVVGTLFAPQAATHIPSKSAPDKASCETVNVETDGQLGPESSVFARYDAKAAQRRDDVSQTLSDLRQWLEGFALQTRADGQKGITVENNASLHSSRKRSLSARAAGAVALITPPQDPTESLQRSSNVDEMSTPQPCSLDVDGTDATILDEHLNSLLSVALPPSPLDGTLEWEERQRTRKEYNAIERARAVRLEVEQLSTQDRKSNLETSAKNWAEQDQNRKLTESNWPDGSLEAAMIEDLDYGDYLFNMMYTIANFEDSKLYLVPRLWNFEDLPRRTRLYSNPAYIFRYLKRERSLGLLIRSRLECLEEGNSQQSEAMVAEEIETLEYALDLRADAAEDYFKLLYDFLSWAIARTTLDIRESAKDSPKNTRTALTNDIPLAIVRGMIETEPELNFRFQRLRDLEQSHFPERFATKPSPPDSPLTPTQPQCTPRGRQIPARQGKLPQYGSAENNDSLRASRTLQRNFKPKNTLLLRVVEGSPSPVPTLDRKMRGEPTSPMKPAETDYLRPPKPKRKLPLRLQLLPFKEEHYTPEPLAPYRLSRPASARVNRYKFYSGLDVDEHTSRRLNPPQRFLSLRQAKRHRALQEPLTPDNIDKIVERNWRQDLRDLDRRYASADDDIVRRHHQVLLEIVSRASEHYIEATSSSFGRRDADNVEDAETSGRILHIVNPRPFDDSQGILDADTLKAVENPNHFNCVEEHKFLDAFENEENVVRVVDFTLPGNTISVQNINSARSTEHVENIDDSRIERSSTLALIEPPNATQERNKKEFDIAVIELASDPNEEVSGETPSQQVEHLKRPISHAEHCIKGKSEVNLVEIETSDPDKGTFHEPPQQPEPIMPAECTTTEAQESFGDGAGVIYTESEGPQTENEGPQTETEDTQAPAQHFEPVGYLPSGLQQIIDREAELTVEEIEGYDTEDEESSRPAKSRMKKENHASRY